MTGLLSSFTTNQYKKNINPPLRECIIYAFDRKGGFLYHCFFSLELVLYVYMQIETIITFF